MTDPKPTRTRRRRRRSTTANSGANQGPKGGGGRRRTRRVRTKSSGPPPFGALPVPQLEELPKPLDRDALKPSFEKLRAKEDLHLNALLPLSLPDLHDAAEALKIEQPERLSRGAAIRGILNARIAKSGVCFATGTIEVDAAGHGYIRHGVNSYTPNIDTDVYLHPSLIQENGLQTGQEVCGVVCETTPEQPILVLRELIDIFGAAPEEQGALAPFQEMVPLYPEERLTLETASELIETRIMDLVSPIGKGQRGLIVAPPRTGKTVLLQMIANAIVENHPECHLIILLVDERPEEVTDFDRTVAGETREIVSSTFDESPARHIKVAEMTLERARTLVEQGKDVVILLDSITRLARSYNNEAPSNSKIMSGGLVADALLKPKRFFGSARNLEDGGSLTILATALIETNSKMDEVIFEEFKGTGNMELVLERRLADRRVWPAIDINRSGTRKEDLLFAAEELQRVWLLRKALNDMDPVEAMEVLLDRMGKSQNNADFLLNLAAG